MRSPSTSHYLCSCYHETREKSSVLITFSWRLGNIVVKRALKGSVAMAGLEKRGDGLCM